MIVRALAMVALVACVRSGGVARAPAPRIDALAPDSVAMRSGRVVEVTVTGRDFVPGSPGRNTIVFDGTLIADVPANADGTTIHFTVPSTLRRSAGAPPAEIAPGAYSVSVRTPAGESNARTLRISQ